MRLHPEDGGSMDLRNIGIRPQDYKVSQTKRPRPDTHRRENLQLA